MLYHQIIEHESSSEWIVFVHGAGGSSNVWFKQLRAFKADYNILLIDLRGHGLSAMKKSKKETYTFNSIALDVIEILDKYNLRQCHFVGLSLGTIVVREIVDIQPDYVKSMIMAGAILKVNIKIRILSNLANVLQRYIPYMMLYKMYANLIMPHPKHKFSRLLFIKNAIKVTHQEFLNWMTLNKNLNKILTVYNAIEPPIQALYVMGENDYVFLSQVQAMLKKHNKYSNLAIIKDAGHICNIDNSDQFNKLSLDFLRNISH